MEGLGEKFQKARIARNLTLEDAGRMTKIRPAKLAEIEAEVFSAFPSLAYAKGFILIYGKFLNVDVTPYLEAFETPDQMTVDGYSYLQDNPAPPPPRPTKVVVRREPSGGGGGGGGGRQRGSLLPLVIGLVVLVGGFSALKFMLDVRRITPSTQRDAKALAQAPAAPATNAPANAVAPGANIGVAPKALPAEGTPPQGALAVATPPAGTETAAQGGQPQATAATTPPVVAAATPVAEPEPEIRRAEPVRPEDLIQARNATAPEQSQTGTNRFDIRPLRKTYVRVTVDNAGGASFDRWVNPTDRPAQFIGKRIVVKVLDPDAVEIRKNGKVIAAGDADITLE